MNINIQVMHLVQIHSFCFIMEFMVLCLLLVYIFDYYLIVFYGLCIIYLQYNLLLFTSNNIIIKSLNLLFIGSIISSLLNLHNNIKIKFNHIIKTFNR